MSCRNLLHCPATMPCAGPSSSRSHGIPPLHLLMAYLHFKLLWPASTSRPYGLPPFHVLCKHGLLEQSLRLLLRHAHCQLHSVQRGQHIHMQAGELLVSVGHACGAGREGHMGQIGQRFHMQAGKPFVSQIGTRGP
eukprot:scaffold149791_cov19-Tisochrysis_lutea.AAC.2